MAVVRVFALAKKLGLRSEALIAALEQMGVTSANAASPVDEATAQAVIELLAEQAQRARDDAAAREAAAAVAEKAPERAKEEAPAEAAPTEEAEEWEEKPEEERIIPRRGPEPVEGIAELRRHVEELERIGVGGKPEKPAAVLAQEARRRRGERPATAVTAPPVVTVLGHVDHGKTTLLDSLRHTTVVDTEHGGITQHIGASEIEHHGKRIVFIDTPGHAAFTQMRARGAQVTDIAILVVAANDGVMPQTIEAIQHARAAEVPIIVAVNKCDLPEADPQRTRQQLLEHGLVPEEWGGHDLFVDVSALSSEGLDGLLESILLVAEVEELWIDPEAPFLGVVIESSVDPAQGAVATVLVRSGEIKVGDVVVAGGANGRVRRLRDWRGKSVKSMEAGRPVALVGLSEAPEAGELVRTTSTPKEARVLAEAYREEQRHRDLRGVDEVQLQALYRGLYGEEKKPLNLLLKADVSGTLEALESTLLHLSERLEEVEINIISSGIGDVNESDILLAVASQAIVIGFNVGADERVLRVAADDRVEVRFYNVIYEILEDIEKAAIGMLEPVFEEQFIGRAQVQALFRVSRLGVIAGCRVTDGRMQRGARIVVKRGRETAYEGTLTSLRHLKNDVNRVEAPSECGINIPDFRGWEESDTIEAYALVEVERKRPTSSEQVTSGAGG